MSLAERAQRQHGLDVAADAVARCRRCGIGATRRNAVYGEGDPCAALMVVGEGPGETEDSLGRPFVGRAGELLDRMLLAIDLPREDVYICNTVKCRPTVDTGTRLANRAPTPDEMRNCRPYLDEQIAIIRPRVILALGAPAAKSFMGEAFTITRQRGVWFDGPTGIPVIATFHPAYILRQTGGGMSEVKRLVWNDLKQVRDRLAAPPPAATLRQETLFEL
ncbi:MAG: uracil-DNA glycosylase [Candidatus Eremiobacteraeota bacterium]|nr:uracil-DNA glycosylase [Candidatus Eremiobacteraeota bacterium]